MFDKGSHTSQGRDICTYHDFVEAHSCVCWYSMNLMSNTAASYPMDAGHFEPWLFGPCSSWQRAMARNVLHPLDKKLQYCSSESCCTDHVTTFIQHWTILTWGYLCRDLWWLSALSAAMWLVVIAYHDRSVYVRTLHIVHSVGPHSETRLK